MGDVGQIVPMKWDIRDKDSIRRAAEYSNVIINLTGRRYDTRNFTMRDVHVDGARRIAEVAKELGVERLIHVSALSAHSLSSDWGKTKWEGDQLVRNIFPNATIVRPATLWGSQDEFLNHFASMMRYWPVYPMVHPEKKWQPIYVNDVAQAIVQSLASKSAPGQIYELAGPSVVTTRQLSDWISRVLKLQDKYTYEVGEEVLWHMGYWLGQHRKPRYTLDSIKENTDIVASNKFPGLGEFDVEPTSVTSQLAISLLHYYRKPVHQSDITLEKNELPDLPRNVGFVPNKPEF
eukprot:TRINITY_DN7700_c0_g1_i19.p1 TRINITY_DN7700_c0_g1~~TRINITY_DN7700_c0_g1_i19.p1  ORF type:complete len:291 (+),score=29.92 TRINITY_DN7700_c0_g1_i19:390-1262(+)